MSGWSRTQVNISTIEVPKVTQPSSRRSWGATSPATIVGHQVIVQTVQLPKTLNQLFVENIYDCLDITLKRTEEQVCLRLGQSVRSARCTKKKKLRKD